MTVSKFTQPNFLTQSASTYKAAIDAAVAVLQQIGGDFAPHAMDSPNMQVVIDAGRIFKPGGTMVSVAQQTTGALVAPVSNPRIDRVVVDSEDGVYLILTGTEATSPTAPSIPNGKLPVCQISMTVGMTEIANSIITDERTTYGPLAKLIRMPVEQVISATGGFVREILLADRGILFDCDCSNGQVTIVLPDTAQAGNGFMIGVIKTDATTNPIVLTPSTTGESFPDGATKTIAAQNGTGIVTTDGLGQWILAFDSSRTYDNVTLTGTPTAPTASTGTETTQLATTAFVANSIAEIKPNWIRASLVGSGLAIAGVGNPALAALNGTDVAFIDSVNDSLRTYRFDGSTWSLVGSGLAIATTGDPALAALNGTDVAFIDNSNESLRTYRFNGSTWSLVGSGLAISGVSGSIVALAALNGTDVAFIDSVNDSLRTYRFDGSTWSLQGSGLTIAGVGNPALAALNGTDVAFIDHDNDSLRTYRFDGSTWSLVGSGLAISGAGNFLALAALNGTDVAFIDGVNDSLRTYRFDGSTWSLQGSGLTISMATGAALAALNGTDIAFIDNLNDELRTYRFLFYIGQGPYHP